MQGKQSVPDPEVAVLRYQRIWLVFTSALCVTGLGAAMASWTAVAALTFLLVATVLASATASLIARDEEALPWRRVITAGLVGAALVVGAAGVVGLLGTWGFVLIVAMAALSPRLLDRAAGLDTAAPAPASVFSEIPQDVPGPDAGTDLAEETALCLAWRDSYIALTQSRGTSLELVIVEQRQELMDELERCHGRVISAWQACGPSAMGGSSPSSGRGR